MNFGASSAIVGSSSFVGGRSRTGSWTPARLPRKTVARAGRRLFRQLRGRTRARHKGLRTRHRTQALEQSMQKHLALGLITALCAGLMAHATPWGDAPTAVAPPP